MKNIFRIAYISCSLLLIGCEYERNYSIEEVKAEISAHLEEKYGEKFTIVSCVFEGSALPFVTHASAVVYPTDIGKSLSFNVIHSSSEIKDDYMFYIAQTDLNAWVVPIMNQVGLDTFELESSLGGSLGIINTSKLGQYNKNSIDEYVSDFHSSRNYSISIEYQYPYEDGNMFDNQTYTMGDQNISTIKSLITLLITNKPNVSITLFQNNRKTPETFEIIEPFSLIKSEVNSYLEENFEEKMFVRADTASLHENGIIHVYIRPETEDNLARQFELTYNLMQSDNNIIVTGYKKSNE